MNHVNVRIGTADEHQPSLGDGEHFVPLAMERPGDPHSVRSNALEVMHDAGLAVASVARDLLYFATAAYCADTRIHRSAGHDNWTRAIRLHFPVEHLDRWLALEPTLTELLSFLTGDHWELRFRQAQPRLSPLPSTQLLPPPPTAVTLFSGGMDSFIGAIDRLEAGEPLGLVSHYGAGTASGAQQRARRVLEEHYPGKTRSYSFYVIPPALAGQDPERTTRSRSVLFLTLGSLVASGIGRHLPLLVPENGLITLNPPLTLARTGSLSTRTTHPHYLALFRKVLAGLDLDIEVDAPYRFLTKGQMAQGVLNRRVFQQGVHQTVSCSHPEVGRFRGDSPGQHCGYCVPCIIRRAALLASGDDDPSLYSFDVLRDALPGRHSARDLRAFEMAVHRFDPAGGHRHLFEVLSTGPIPPEEAQQYVEVYRSGMQELRQFFGVGQPVTI